MKKIGFFVIAVMMMGATALPVSAQKYGTTADSTECIKYLSFYLEHFKLKNYNEAIPQWRKAYKYCPPTASQNMLIHGTSLVRILINQNSKNVIYKDQLVDTLLNIHDQRAEFYPKYAVIARNNKGLDLVNYVKDDADRIYKGLEEIIEQNKEKTRPSIFVNHFNAVNTLYDNGSLSPEEVMSIYSRNMEYLSAITPKNSREQEELDKVKSAMENILISSQVASCENLIELYTPRFEANPEDVAIATNIVKMMSVAEDCMDNDLFLKAVNAMYKFDPSHTSAFFLYKLYSSRGDVDNALKYLEEAIAYPESDDVTDAGYYLEAATVALKEGRFQYAYNAALKVPSLDKSLAAKSYMLLGTIWGSQSCKGNDIEKRAQFWVAVDYMLKAKKEDPSLAEEANANIARYSQYYPQTGEAFMYDLTEGQSYTVSCNGMRAVTTVRTQK